MISLGGLFFGPWTAAVACLMTIPLRLVQGGPGALMGVLVILASAGIGVGFHRRRRSKPGEEPLSTLLLVGILVHLAMLALTVALPSGTILPVLTRIGWPVILVYPLATVLIGKVLSDQAMRTRSLIALQESERNYRELVQYANSIILRWTCDGKVSFLNEFGQTFFGYAAAEIVGRHVVGTIVPETESTARDLKSLMDQITENPKAFEQNVNENMRRNGERVWIAWTNRTVLDSVGRVIEVLSVGHDITDRRTAQLALLDSEKRLRLALDAAHMGTFDWDPHTNRIIWSRWHEDLWGFSLGEFDGTYQAFSRRIHPRDLPEVEAEFAKCAVTREPFAREFRVVWPDSAVHWIASTGQYEFDEDGHPVRMRGTVREITKRKRAEEELQAIRDSLEQRVRDRTAELAVAKERAESADRLKSAFLATMSHELRTPLNSIIGFTGIMLQGLAGPLNEEQTKQLGMVQKSARHLLALINDVLDISKIEAGQVEIRLEPFDLRASLDRVVDLVRPLAQKKGLALRLSLTPGNGLVVSDRRRVEQVLLNLLNNAVKFTEQGEVALIANFVPELQFAQVPTPRSGISIQVADTGIGIKPEDLSKLFLPFRQVDTGLTRQHEGTGLGLAICRRLVELLGGEIAVQTTWGQGSTFTVVLPVTSDPSP